MNLGTLEDRIVQALVDRILGADTTANTGNAVPQRPQLHPFIGKFCILRCTGAGVHAGVVESVQGDSVTLAPGALRLWTWKANASKGALYTLASKGLATGSKTEKNEGRSLINGVCELIEVAPAVVITFKAVWE